MNVVTTDIVRGVHRSERLAECWAAMEEIIGEPLPRVNRTRKYFYARALIHHRMHLDGYSGNGTATLLGVNHATAYNARRQAEWAIDHPRLYPTVSAWWKELNKRIRKI
jgi:hypothetical protein